MAHTSAFWYYPHEPVEHISTAALESLDEGPLGAILGQLDGTSRAELRLASRVTRCLANSITHRLRLTGFDLEHLCLPPSQALSAPETSCAFSLRLSDRFPLLAELRLADASPCFRASDRGRSGSGGLGSRTGSGYLHWAPSSPQQSQQSQQSQQGTTAQQTEDSASWVDQTLDSPRPRSSVNPGRVTDDLVEALVTHDQHTEALRRVRVLDVKGCGYLTAKGLRHLLKATPSLQRFTATRWAEAASLLDCPSLAHLQSLNLGDAEVDIVSVDDTALQVVARCASLTHLSLQRCVAVSDRGLAALAALPRLAHLSVAGTRVTGEGLAHCCRTLTTLDASGAALFNDRALHALQGCSLTTLQVEGTACTNTGLVALQQLPRLIRLELGSQFEATDAGLAALGACPALTWLTFGAFNITGPPARGAFPALTHVQFGGSYLNRGMRFAFPLGPLVEHIVAAGFDTVTDVHVRCMARQRSLRRLDLHGGYQLTDQGIRALSALPHLEHLTLVTCPTITQQTLEQLLSETRSLDHVTVRASAWQAVEAGRKLTRTQATQLSPAAATPLCAASREA